jgi:Flp pilus assembly protein TadG
MRRAARWLRSRLAMSWRDERGAAAVEFALVLPILILLLFGIIEFSRVWNLKQTLTDAAREGTRIAVISERMELTQTQLEDSVRRTVMRIATLAALDSAQLHIDPIVGGSPGTTAQVALEYPYDPLFGAWFPGLQSLQLRTTFVMRNE